MAKLKVGVLISGRGSNMASLVRSAWEDDYPAEIACVISNVASAPGVKIARDAGIATAVIAHGDYPDRETFDRAVTAELEKHHVRLVALAGFMRIQSPWFPQHWRNRVINVHPSLLPALPRPARPAAGDRRRRARHRLHGALRHGRGRCRADHRPGRRAGAGGRHRRAARRRASCARSIASIPWSLRWFGEGRVAIVDGRVEVKGVPPDATLLFSPEP